jgi:hypothetical protein
MTIPYDTDHGLRNAVLLELANDITIAGGTVVGISASAGETHPNWVVFINKLNTAANGLGVTPTLPTYEWLDYSAFQSVVNTLRIALANLTSVPVNTNPPVVTGTGAVGDNLTTSNGTWTNLPTDYTYQWVRSGVPIIGATEAVYALVGADQGNNVGSRVIANNVAGSSAPVLSNTIAVV